MAAFEGRVVRSAAGVGGWPDREVVLREGETLAQRLARREGPASHQTNRP